MHTFGLFTGNAAREIKSLDIREGGAPLIKPIRSDLLLMCAGRERRKIERKRVTTPRTDGISIETCFSYR